MLSGKAWKTPAIVAAAALVAGCGGARRAQTPPPRLARALAQDLAARSDAVAASVVRGDRCTAAGRAASLAQAAHSAARAGRISPAFRARLLTAVDSLAASLPACPPPSPPSPQGQGNGHDHGKHNGEHKHGNEGGD